MAVPPVLSDLVSAPNAPSRSGQGGRTAASKFYQMPDNLELDPGMIGHAGVLAVFLANHGRLDEALEIISRGLDERPGDGALLRTREEIIALRRSG